jgi:hypothetical protein
MIRLVTVVINYSNKSFLPFQDLTSALHHLSLTLYQSRIEAPQLYARCAQLYFYKGHTESSA